MEGSWARTNGAEFWDANSDTAGQEISHLLWNCNIPHLVVSTGVRYCIQSKFSHPSSRRLVLYPPMLSHRVRVWFKNFVWIFRTESYWIDGLYWEYRKKFEGIDLARIFLMFLVSAILPYSLLSHLAIVFTRMFVRLVYRYRRFGLVDAGQRLSEGNVTVGSEWGSV
jgi:hypothetical protein